MLNKKFSLVFWIATTTVVLSFLLSGCNSSSRSDVADEDHYHHDPVHHHTGAVRALVGDGSNALSMYTLEDGALVEQFSVADVSNVYATEDGRFAIIVQRGNAQQFSVIDSGVWVLDHVDHVHLEIDPPRLLNQAAIRGADYASGRPAHAVSINNRVAVFFDGEPDTNQVAAAVVFSLADLQAGVRPSTQVYSGSGHHGIAVPTPDGHIIMSVAESSGADPRARTGVRIYDAQGHEVAAFAHSCPGLHGYAVLGNTYLFGCHRQDDGEGGVLRIRHQPHAAHIHDRFIHDHISYPEGNLHVANFTSHAESAFSIAPWGTQAMLRIHPERNHLTSSDILQLPQRQCGYSFNDDDAQELLVLTTDGFLRRYEVHNWQEIAQIQVMEPFECNIPRPVLRSVDDKVYLTRPAQRDLITLDLAHHGAIVQHITLPTSAVQMVVFRYPAGLKDYGSH